MLAKKFNLLVWHGDVGIHFVYELDKLRVALSTIQYLPFAEGTSYARICARATSLTFIHPKATLGYVEDDPARKFEGFLVKNQTEMLIRVDLFWQNLIRTFTVHDYT